MLETFGYLEELHQAILAAREVAPAMQLVAQVTIDEDGNCLDGASPETFTSKLIDWGVDVIGCNCSVGPVAMLEAIERIRRLTDKRWLPSRMPAFRAVLKAATSIVSASPDMQLPTSVNAGVTLVGAAMASARNK